MSCWVEGLKSNEGLIERDCRILLLFFQKKKIYFFFFFPVIDV